ncbi:sensor histidine kinase [Nordella sp. HKS 07]|uniref:sensor histidine kinase n=1 Tax=Nordella sp. HKS 07 TaxID=2712222 RepID=UPI0013E1E7F7|nr:sensor histidine kinase [Nordella sp. HKS 07]QIG50935.1 sensor histidine kinase [Nordella sp. HKS 07]
MTRSDSSLFTRLAVRVAVVLCIGATALVSAAWYYARAAADDAYDRVLTGAALQLADSLTVDAGQMIVDLPASAFELLGLAERDRLFYRIVDTEGATLTGYADLAEDSDLSAVRTEPVLRNGSYAGDPVRIVVIARAFSDPALSGWAHVIVAQTTEAREALAAELTTRAVFLVLVMSLMALAGAALAIRYSLQPVWRLGNALNNRDSHDLKPIEVDMPREMRPFVGSINHFMGRLERRVSLLERFIADAAHQIRTPLTALTAQVDLLGQDRLSADARQHLERVQQRAQELARLTNQLLSHAMVIHRADAVRLAPVNLADIARRAFRAAVPITHSPDIIISFEADESDPKVLGDAVSLREAIANVIDNALRHGTLSRLEVRVSSKDGTASVEVEDDGPGIPPEAWEGVTQRFATTRHNGGAAGLGFSIAAEVAAAHGGTLTFREKGARGFTVVLALPLLSGDGDRA